MYKTFVVVVVVLTLKSLDSIKYCEITVSSIIFTSNKYVCASSGNTIVYRYTGGWYTCMSFFKNGYSVLKILI